MGSNPIGGATKRSLVSRTEAVFFVIKIYWEDTMKTEHSCGAVVFTRQNGIPLYVIVQSKEGFFGFPKGHTEANETEEETALREIKEETGLSPSLIPGFRTEDEHLIPFTHKEPVMKHIVYFLAEYKDQSPKPQEEEISAIRLMPYEEAMAAFQFESSRRILTEARRFLQQE